MSFSREITDIHTQSGQCEETNIAGGLLLEATLAIIVWHSQETQGNI